MHFTRVNSGTTLNIRLVVVRVFAAAMGLCRPSLAAGIVFTTETQIKSQRKIKKKILRASVSPW